MRAATLGAGAHAPGGRLVPRLVVLGGSLAALSQASYNLAPGPGELVELGLFATALLLFALFPLRRRLPLRETWAYALLAGFVMLTASVTDPGGDLRYLQRLGMAVAVFALVLWAGDLRLTPGGRRVLRAALMLASALALAQAFLGPPVVFGGKARLAVFAGGADGLHPSAYTAFALALSLGVIGAPEGRAARLARLALIAGLGVAVILYQVRTVWVMAALMGGLVLWQRHRPRLPRALGSLIAIWGLLALAAGLVLLATIGPDRLSAFSSGRSVIYAERLALVMSRDLPELLLGTGAGTDFFTGDSVWRYEAKNSHNDILMLLIETGVAGLALLSGAVVFAARALAPSARPILLAYLATSLISNGLILRPSAGALFVFAMLVVAARAREGRGA